MLPRWWTDPFGEVPPLGYRLREAFPDRWLRIHSLPESKRYPDNEEELEEVLRRQAVVAGEVLIQDEPCRVVTPTYELAEVGGRRSFDEFDRVFECVGANVADEVWFWTNTAAWNAKTERPALVAIAEDRLRALWLNEFSGEIYAPYDGGADLIVANRQRRDRLAQRFSSWVSPRSDGL